MSCDNFNELILDSILKDSDTHNKIELQKHIKTCNKCRLEYEQIQSAVKALSPDTSEGLTLVEKLQLENEIYEDRLRRLSGRNSGIVWFKRLTAVAAALFFFFLGYSIRSVSPDNLPAQNMASDEKSIEKRMNLQLSRISGQRVSPRGLLLIAKGKKALEEYEFLK